MTGKELTSILAAAAFGLSLIIGHIGIREGAVIIGDGGILAAILSAITLLGVAAAAFSAWSSHKAAQSTLQQGVEAEISGRFLTGSQMVGSGKRSVEASGLMVLADIAIQHERYVQPVTAVLVGHIMDQDREIYESIYKDISQGAVGVERRLPSSTKPAFWAFNSLGMIRRHKYGQFGSVPATEKTTITDAFLFNGIVQGQNFGGIEASTVVAGKLTIMNSGLAGSSFIIYAIDPIHLVGDNCEGLDIQMLDVREAVAGSLLKLPLLVLKGVRGTPRRITVDGIDYRESKKVRIEAE